MSYWHIDYAGYSKILQVQGIILLEIFLFHFWKNEKEDNLETLKNWEVSRDEIFNMKVYRTLPEYLLPWVAKYPLTSWCLGPGGGGWSSQQKSAHPCNAHAQLMHWSCNPTTLLQLYSTYIDLHVVMQVTQKF